jgi:hypothetical protein
MGLVGVRPLRSVQANPELCNSNSNLPQGTVLGHAIGQVNQRLILWASSSWNSVSRVLDPTVLPYSACEVLYCSIWYQIYSYSYSNWLS